MSTEHGLTYLVCDKCGAKVIHGAKRPLDGWGAVKSYGNDGEPGVEMMSLDLCPKCLSVICQTVRECPLP